MRRTTGTSGTTGTTGRAGTAGGDGAGLQNWAGTYTYRARTVHEPTDVEGVRSVVAGSRRVRALGSRHSFHDLADSDALLSLAGLPVEMDVDADAGTVRVGGGVRYGTLAEHLYRHGWALHTMASLPHISVAGAVATATHGSGNANVNLAAVVTEVDLVTADGDLVHLTREDDRFPAVVVGLGAVGVVTALTVAVEPAYDAAQEVYTDLPWDAALEHFDEISGTADSVSLFVDWGAPTVGQVWRKSRVVPGWQRRADLFGAQPATTKLHPLPGVDPVSTTDQLGVPGPWHERLPHFRMDFTPSNGEEIQSEYLVAREHAPAAMQALRGLGERISPLLLVSEVRTVAPDDLWLSAAYERATVGLHFTWKRLPAEVRALLPDIEAVLAPFDPRPHWGKVFTTEGAGAPATLERLYPRLADFRALATRMDPEGRFHNDYLLRHGLVQPAG